jgi:hypothetical protein
VEVGESDGGEGLLGAEWLAFGELYRRESQRGERSDAFGFVGGVLIDPKGGGDQSDHGALAGKRIGFAVLES